MARVVGRQIDAVDVLHGDPGGSLLLVEPLGLAEGLGGAQAGVIGAPDVDGGLGRTRVGSMPARAGQDAGRRSTPSIRLRPGDAASATPV